MFLELIVYWQLTPCVPQFAGGRLDIEALGLNLYSRLANPNLFVVKYQSFTKFSIRWPVSR